MPNDPTIGQPSSGNKTTVQKVPDIFIGGGRQARKQPGQPSAPPQKFGLSRQQSRQRIGSLRKVGEYRPATQQNLI
jgi:hypothetical protein